MSPEENRNAALVDLPTESPTRISGNASFPDLGLPDHTGRDRRLSELAGGDPVALIFSRGWWCPKDQAFMRRMVELQAHVCALTDPHAQIPYDEPEVQGVRRDAMGWWIPLLADSLICLSSLATDVVNYAGAITVASDPARFAEDPFARLFTGTTVKTDLFSVVAPPAGPLVERYTGAPWPAGSFAAAD